MARGELVSRLKFRVSANSLEALVGRFQVSNRRLNAALRRRVETYHDAVKATTEATAPVLTGYMSEHVETRFAKDRLAAETGWFRDTFLNDFEQTKGKFYPQYPEFGTERQVAKPSLGPAALRHQPAFQAGVKADLRQWGRR